jgi:hypothetical protein
MIFFKIQLKLVQKSKVTPKRNTHKIPKFLVTKKIRYFVDISIIDQ